MNSRREFIRTSFGIGAAVVVGANILDTENSNKNRFGLQLYTVRDVLPKDPKSIIRQIASFGYSEIESYEGAEGMFWGMEARAFSVFLSDLGLSINSSHCDISKDFKSKVETAASIGMKHLICAWKGPQAKLDDFKLIADEFNKCGEICKKSGIRFAYHNHDYSFRQLEGQIPQDVLMQHTDASLVDFEMDIYWVVAAGEDPIAWFEKYPGRFRYCHIKDRTSNPGPDNSKNSTDLGNGTINFKKILKTGSVNGLRHFIVEQEHYPISTSMEAVAHNARYMKKLKF
jgi:sugar phosphate isomerase/epimerase